MFQQFERNFENEAKKFGDVVGNVKDNVVHLGGKKKKKKKIKKTIFLYSKET